MLDLIEPAVTALATHGQTVRILADISSDGTSNGAIMSIVRRVILAVSVIGGAAFVIHALRVQMDKDSAGKTKKLTDEAKSFAYFEGLCGVVWVIAELAQNVFGGAAS